MILKAVENGVSEERIAKSLNADVVNIRRRRKLHGICTEAAVAATPKAQLAPGYQPGSPKGLSDEKVAFMERESASLARDSKWPSRRADHLDLVLANSCVSKLLRNGGVVGYLAKNYQELLFELQIMTEAEATAA